MLRALLQKSAVTVISNLFFLLYLTVITIEVWYDYHKERGILWLTIIENVHIAAD